MSSLSGDGTVQIRYRNYGVSELHTKLYISDQDVIISSQHPSDTFMNIYGSSIMFNDLTVRNYYDNYFNSLWSVSSIDLSNETVQTPRCRQKREREGNQDRIPENGDEAPPR